MLLPPGVAEGKWVEDGAWLAEDVARLADGARLGDTIWPADAGRRERSRGSGGLGRVLPAVTGRPQLAGAAATAATSGSGDPLGWSYAGFASAEAATTGRRTPTVSNLARGAYGSYRFCRLVRIRTNRTSP